MLTNPFIDSRPAYSGNATGLRSIGGGTILLLGAIKGVLQAAGWAVIEQGPSTGTQTTIAVNMPIAVPPTDGREPVEMEDPCGILNPARVQLTVGGIAYVGYDPFQFLPPLDCDDRFYYPAAGTDVDTAISLADKITEETPFLCSYAGFTEVGTILMSKRLLFHFEPKPPYTFEWDDIPLSGAGGSKFTSKGYYVLRSPLTASGNYLEVKLQTLAITSLGIDEDAVLGALTPFLTVSSSGGGEYAQAIYPGGYFMQASERQFAIWNEEGTGRAGSALLASMPHMDLGHTTGAEPCISVGSESNTWFGYTFGAAFQQLTNALHWEQSYATGFNSSLVDMGFRTQETSGLWRNPTLMHRGLRGVPLTALNDAPFSEGAYVLLSADPNAQQIDRIGGRLWDMIVTTSAAPGDEASAVFDGHNWRRMSTSTAVEDVTASLWVRED